jgi:hypothetical protein
LVASLMIHMVKRNEHYVPPTRQPKKKAKKKTGPKKIVPAHTPQRKRQISKFKNKIKVTPEVKANPYAFTVGQPRIYPTPADLCEELNKWVIWLQGEKGTRIVLRGRRKVEEEYWVRPPEPATITGLALFLGFASRQSLEDYDKLGGEFSYLVKRAKNFVARGYERLLHEGKPVGGIFALKNIDKWVDRIETHDETLHDIVKGFNYVVPEKPADYDPREDVEDVQK